MFYIFFSCYILQLIKSAIQHWRFYYLSSQIQWNYFIVGNIGLWSFNLFKLLEFRSSNWNTKEMSIKWTWSDANFRPYQPKILKLNKYLNQFSSNFRALYIFKSDLVTREIVKKNFNKPCKRLMPCPFTGPKMFCAGPNFLCLTKNVFTYGGSHKNFEPDKKMICIQ